MSGSKNHSPCRRTLRGVPLARPARLATTALLALVALPGCGGSKVDKAEIETRAPAPRVAHVSAEGGAQPAQPAVRTPPPKRQPAPVAQPAAPPPIDPTADPRDRFEIVSGQPTFEVVVEHGRPRSADLVAAVPPPRGVNSDRFEVVGPVDGSQRTAPAAARPPAATRGTVATRGTGGTGSEKPAEGSLPAGFVELASIGRSRLGWPLRIRSERDGAEMVLVEGGGVVVGHDGEPPESNPQITVVLDSFYMDVAEVTVGQYERFRQLVRAEKRTVMAEPTNAASPGDFPVLGVPLLQAQLYARWAGKELPTESEWERAARGESGFEHPWGNGPAIWKTARGQTDIGPVRAFPTDRSAFGIYDLAGNAREWCVDRYSPTAFADALKGSPTQLRNWKGARIAQPDNYNVVKGNGPNWEAWYRTGVNGSDHAPDVGFRCVLRPSAKRR